MKTSSESQRRRSTSSPPRVQSRPSPKSRPRPKSRLTEKTNKNQTRTRNKSRTTMNESPPSDTINLDSSNEDGPADPLSSPELSSGPGPDVVDLTSVSSDPAAVVDLTNDTVLVLDEEQTQSYVVSSDEEEPTVTGTRTTSTSTAPQRRETRSSGVHISCPVCMDSYFEIVDSGRLLVSTRCGHVFCSICLRDALNQSRSCPICRKKLQKGHYHPIHI